MVVPDKNPATVPAAREQAALRGFALRRLRVGVHGRMVSLVVPDVASFRKRGDWIDDAQRRNEPPYWVQVWPASLALARWLGGSELAGVPVVDLGCGLGLPGITAAGLGAAVTFADQSKDALAFAEWNGNCAAQAAGCGPPARVLTQCLDWNHSDLTSQFAIILLSDVTYRPVHHAGVRRQIARALTPDGVVLHSDPWRAESTEFLRSLREGFAVATATYQVVDPDRSTDVRLCAASRSQPALARWVANLPKRARLVLEPAGAPGCR